MRYNNCGLPHIPMTPPYSFRLSRMPPPARPRFFRDVGRTMNVTRGKRKGAVWVARREIDHRARSTAACAPPAPRPRGRARPGRRV